MKKIAIAGIFFEDIVERSNQALHNAAGKTELSEDEFNKKVDSYIEEIADAFDNAISDGNINCIANQ